MLFYSKVTTTQELQTWNLMNMHSKVVPTHLQVNGRILRNYVGDI